MTRCPHDRMRPLRAAWQDEEHGYVEETRYQCGDCGEVFCEDEVAAEMTAVEQEELVNA